MCLACAGCSRAARSRPRAHRARQTVVNTWPGSRCIPMDCAGATGIAEGDAAAAASPRDGESHGEA